MATKVTLREKPISGNRKSLYLDFYPPIPHPETGEPTRREFLGYYIHSPIKTKKGTRKRKDGSTAEVHTYDSNPAFNAIFEKHNEDTLKLAEQIRQQRQNILNKPEVYSQDEKNKLKAIERGELNFVEYFKKLADKRKASNHDNWVSAYNYLTAFTKGILKFTDLNEAVCNDFKEHLLTSKSNKNKEATLSQNSAVSYFNKFKATLKQAYKDGFIQNDLNARIEPIKTAETHRNFLTIDELNSLIQTECRTPLMKKAALFSALTGLRFSDIQKLTWNEVIQVESGCCIQFTQKKTKGAEVLPISEQASSLMGEPQKPTDKVFDGLEYSAYYNKHLFQWIGAAGITKDITFHCFRHTYAVLQLSEGTDIYTLMKLLGHREIKTTQIYAKVQDKAKREAASKIKLKM